MYNITASAFILFKRLFLWTIFSRVSLEMTHISNTKYSKNLGDFVEGHIMK